MKLQLIGSSQKEPVWLVLVLQSSLPSLFCTTVAECSAKSVFQYCVLCQVCFVIVWQSTLPSLLCNSVTEYVEYVLYQYGRVFCQVYFVLAFMNSAYQPREGWCTFLSTVLYLRNQGTGCPKKNGALACCCNRLTHHFFWDTLYDARDAIASKN